MSSSEEQAVVDYVYYKNQIELAGFHLDECLQNRAGKYNIFTSDKKYCIACCDTFEQLKSVYHALMRFKQLIAEGCIDGIQTVQDTRE